MPQCTCMFSIRSRVPVAHAINVILNCDVEMFLSINRVVLTIYLNMQANELITVN